MLASFIQVEGGNMSSGIGSDYQAIKPSGQPYTYGTDGTAPNPRRDEDRVNTTDRGVVAAARRIFGSLFTRNKEANRESLLKKE